MFTADYSENVEKLSGAVYWMLQDGQPSTRQLLNSSQAIVSSYLNDACGNNISSSGSAANPFRWNGGSGYYSDAESGLQKVGARYYDPSVGNWISQDTMLIAGSPADSQAVNRYLYCGANPVGRVDPKGRNWLWDVVVAGFLLLLGLALEGVAALVVLILALGALVYGIFEGVRNALEYIENAKEHMGQQAASAGVGPGDGYVTPHSP